MTAFIGQVQNKQIYGAVSQLPGAGNEGEVRRGVTANEYGVSFRGDENVLKVFDDDSTFLLSVQPFSCTLKMSFM